jgi:predicted DNA-binding transcriptional regulator AlpA
MNQNDEIDPLLSEKVVARTLGLSHRTLQTWRKCKKGPPWVRLGRSVRYPREGLKMFVATRSSSLIR